MSPSAQPQAPPGTAPSDPHRPLIEPVIGLVVLLLLVVGCTVVLLPFVSALILAAVLCFSTWPVFLKLTHLMGGRKTLAAFTMVVLLAAIIIVPFAFLGSNLVDNVRAVVAAAHRMFAAGPPQPPEWLGKIPFVGDRIRDYWIDFSQDVASQSAAFEQVIGTLAKLALEFGKLLGQGLLEIGLSLVICFFLYRDGGELALRLARAATRISGGEAERLVEVAALTVRGVVYAIIGTSLIQGMLFGLGFLLAGVPGALVLGFATFILSFVPAGTALIWIPSAIWLVRQGDTAWGVFIVIWGIIVGGLLENLLRPILMRGTGSTPLILILLGVLGGTLAFGFVGIFIGPTLLAIGHRLLQVWTDDVETAAAPAPAAESDREPRRKLAD
jgi:predicted PurR-regulated permease PerM